MGKTINFSELFAKNVLQQYYYKNLSLQVGDNYFLRLPDIYNADHSIGIEVGQAELQQDYLYETLAKELEQQPTLGGKVALLQKKLNSRPVLKKEIENIQRMNNGTQILAKFPVMKAKKIPKELPIFVGLTQEKVLRANKGNYKGCKQINLCIVSYYRKRDYKLVQQYANALTGFEKLPFTRVFLILSTSLFVIEKDKSITVIDYSDEEFIALQHKTQQELKQTKNSKPTQAVK